MSFRTIVNDTRTNNLVRQDTTRRTTVYSRMHPTATQPLHGTSKIRAILIEMLLLLPSSAPSPLPLASSCDACAWTSIPQCSVVTRLVMSAKQACRVREEVRHTAGSRMTECASHRTRVAVKCRCAASSFLAYAVVPAAHPCKSHARTHTHRSASMVNKTVRTTPKYHWDDREGGTTQNSDQLLYGATA